MTSTFNRLPYTICNQSLTFFVKGKPYSLTREHERFAEAKQLLQAPGDHDAEHLIALVDVRKALLRDSFGAITFIGQDIVFKGRALAGLWVDKILEFQRAGEPFGPLWNALGSLVQNPTATAIDRLPVFLEKSQLGFLEDGRFIAYKAVREDYFDLHTGRTHRNMVGDTPHMDRDQVDADPNSCCSTGLHVGTPGYVKSWAHGANKVMLIAVWPHDVVSVPFSYDGNKMRICAYEVIDELDEEYAGTLIGRPVLTPRSQLPAPNDAVLPADEADLDQGVEDEEESEDLPQDDSVKFSVGDVVEYVQFDATLYGIVIPGDQVRDLDGTGSFMDEIVRVLEPAEITAAVVACEGALIRVEGDTRLRDGDYTIAGYSDDDDDNQLDHDSRFWKVDFDGIDGGVPVLNSAIKVVNLLGEHLWPRTEVKVDAEAGTVEMKSLDGHDLRHDLPTGEVLAAAWAATDRVPLVGDNVIIGAGGWPPAGMYPVIAVRQNGPTTIYVVQTEHDGQVDIDGNQIVRVIRRPWMQAEIGGQVELSDDADSSVGAGWFEVADLALQQDEPQIQIRGLNGNWWIWATRVLATKRA